MTDELESLKQQLQGALAEIDKLRKENARLKQTATPPGSTSVIKPKVKVHQSVSTSSKIHSQSSAEKKIKRVCVGGGAVITLRQWRHVKTRFCGQIGALVLLLTR